MSNRREDQTERFGATLSRQVWRAHCTDTADLGSALPDLVQELTSGRDAGQVMTASLFRWDQRLFLYLETIGDNPVDSLTAPLAPHLLSWPGEQRPRHWGPMTDIFHYHRCLGADQWRRKTPPDKRTARVLRLRPQMASSYIFLHYQLQEERPAGGDKYGLISLHDDIMFFYAEEPTIVEPPRYAGELSTQNTPGDWHTLMEPHFLPWDDEGEEALWRPIECLFSL